MEKRSCPSGYRWDSLLRNCISLETQGLTPSADPPPMLKPALSTSGPGPDEPWSAISPSLWICVALVASGSVLVLLLWFIIYKRHGRTSQNTGEKDSTPHTLATIEQEEKALSPWLHVNGQTQEVSISVASCGRSLCNGRAEHGLPLPATELGDSALVTAKTGQPVEV
ncbi:tumor necrosis factor receptor superfamily member 13C-like [Megalobrama amblycephala]|uniref:tumor necrosis factor receptor superfamily member 13C-like n=1 Tax=Megalobrama amblycephala TaxID=75352 RepID=UPI00201454ED|nr:tumor necrosis factor receptor superfamily member 13C-like [Megalobrama amblycephala]XP_048037543.1 tumor necrosis factor receptor superfamily member 13C-like [Megalobrama amblycephala]XP_048037553.1 tumor necrosis factor receptor superfamily member 13C-like [Megalobrama amblycephala]